MKLKFFLIHLYDNRNMTGRSYLQLFCPTCISFTGVHHNHWYCSGSGINSPAQAKNNNNSVLYCSGYKQNNDKVKKL